MVKKLFISIVVSASFFTAYSQQPANKPPEKTRQQIQQERKEKLNKLIKQSEEGALIYSKQSAFGIKLNTDGWGAFYEHGKYKTIENTNIWWVEFGERKSPKEEKLTRGEPIGGGLFLVGNPFVYGKRNNFYYLKGGLGQQRLIGGKGNQNGVAVSAVYGGGLSLGYLKPYYIAIADRATGGTKDVKFSDSTVDTFLNYENITGGSGFTKGFGQGTIVPGAFAKMALRFDYGRFNEFISAIELGVNAEYYTKEMPIMINNPAKKFFFNGYIALEFGRRK